MTRRSEWFQLATILIAAAGLMAATAPSPTSSSRGIPGIPIERCGGPNHTLCRPGFYCQKTTEVCPIKGGPGVCKVRPQKCPGVVVPVCGCNNVTYANECQAERAGVSVAHQGRCQRVLGVIVSHPPPKP